MVGIETLLRLVGGVALLLANGFFVTTEFAMTRVPQFDPAEFEGNAGLERALEMTDRLEIYLSGCQVGITIASVGLGIVAEPAFTAVVDGGLNAVDSAFGFGLGLGATAEGGHSALAVIVSLAIINILHVIIGEQTPTYLGVERTKFVAKYLAPLLYYWTKLMSPVIRIADWTSKAILGLFGVSIDRSWSEAEMEEESEAVPMDRGTLRRQMGEMLSRGSISSERREEVLNALEIGETPARDVMIPLPDVVGVYTDASSAANLATVEQHPEFTRYPLFDGEPPADHEPGDPHGESSLPAERVVGIVYTSGVLPNVDNLRDGTEEFRDIAAPPLTISAETPVADVIDEFQAEKQEFAAVVEGRSVVGVVTATDTFETITGEVEDPMDAVAVEPGSGDV